MGDFEDFFEDDELLTEDNEKETAAKNKQEKPKQPEQVQKTEAVAKDKTDDDDMSPGMIDLEAIEATGGYSFDEDDNENVENAADASPDQKELESTQNNISFDEEDSTSIEETASMAQVDFSSDDQSEEQGQETKTFKHIEHDEEDIDLKEVPQHEQLDENSSVIKQSLKLSEEEKQQRINSVLEKSAQSILSQAQNEKAQEKSPETTNNLFVNLDESELFSNIETLDTEPSNTSKKDSQGIDFGDDEKEDLVSDETKDNINQVKQDDTSTVVGVSSGGKAEDFDAFESFLKEELEQEEQEDPISEIVEDLAEQKLKFELPAWLSQISMPKIPIWPVVALIVASLITVTFFYRKTIEQVVFNRTPYSPPTETQLQKISIITSKAKQEYLYDHVLSQKKAISYLNESLLIDPRHKETLYLKALVEAQMLIDEAVVKKTVKNGNALVVLDEFFPDSEQFLIAEAYSLLASEQIEKSLAQFKKLKKIYPKNIDLSMGYAEALVREDKYDEAYQVLASINSGHRRVHFLKAFCLSQLDTKRAYEIYMKSIDNISSYHPKLEFLKLKMQHNNELLDNELISKFENNLKNNTAKYPSSLLAASYVILSEVFLENQDIEKAVLLLKNATKNSTDDKTFFKMALLQKKIGDTKGAIASFQKAYELSSNNEKYLIEYLYALRKSGEYKKAINLADENSEKYKQSGHFLYEYALIKKGLLRTDEALEHLEQAKEISDKIEYDIAIATIYMEKDDYDQAYKTIGKILEKDSQNELALIYKGKILTAYHVFGLAEKSLTSIKKPYVNAYQVYQAFADYYLATDKKTDLTGLMREVEKTDLNAYEKDMLLSKELLENKKYEEALERLKSHQLKDKKDIELNALLGQIYFASNNPKQAIAVLEESMKINRGDFETLFLLGKALIDIGQLDAGIEKLLLASEIQSKVPNIWFELQKAHIAKDNQEKVAFYFKQAIDKNAQYLPAYISMADYYFSSNLYSKAKPLYTKVIQIEPKAEQAYYNLAVIEKFNRNTDKAKSYFKKAIQLNRKNSQAYIALGILEEEGRNVSVAQRLFEKAKQVDPNNPEPYYLLGLSYRQSGRYQRAIQHFQKYLDLNPNAKDKQAIEDEITFLRKNMN
ncbi:tetratricopeptide repeat protein [bacterium]|nr:tetratricopeptide repeat protein [bacterium]